MYGLSDVCASITSFFTHNLLFLLLNLMIATIAFISAFTNRKKHQNLQHDIAPYLFDEIPQRTEMQFVRDSSADDFHDALEEIAEEEKEVLCIDDIRSKLTVSHPSTSKSDTEPAAGGVAAELPAASAHFEDKEVVEERRPGTLREGVIATVTDGDEEVDAKADDFINRFKQQLKLQMLDPINRYS